MGDDRHIPQPTPLTLTVEVTCCLCQAEHIASILLPVGWELTTDTIDDETGFCPQHAPMAAWTQTQCPGCMGGWTECHLWDDFAYRHLRLTDEDFAQIESGRWPRRMNGTFSAVHFSITDEDLSTPAPRAVGHALAEAIRAYHTKYGARV